ncbi:hypothetical protein M408DRAFT_140845 [Serendipita vermifera MAFF 305830]|uniref:Nephrocystin 3-like N-terminal domain-containing protein n=1 Tax=Serendipita vermifera MAFF 305830 TaxID=933852 RepID=A0A0C2WQC3_SERVB|nr:hypothetical protein M408DRAFT_140845 [Serendipita vermifera MAFF 305830]
MGDESHNSRYPSRTCQRGQHILAIWNARNRQDVCGSFLVPTASQGGVFGGKLLLQTRRPNLREPKRVLPTLVSKLAAMWGPYRTLVAQALRDDPQLNPDSTSGELLLKPLGSLRRHPVHALVLVIDALDECGDAETRKRLLHTLREASRRIKWLKIIVTSRPKADIQPFFKAARGMCRDLDVDNQDFQDIQYFAEQRISSLIQSHSLPNEWPGAQRLSQIIQRSGGLFIYVETMIRLLRASKDPDEPLDRVLNGEQEDDSAELHKLYSTAIALCVGQEAKKFRLIARAILVVAAYRPLSDDTPASLMGEKSHVVKAWVNHLGSLLYRDETQNDAIRVRHLSIFEFLTGSSCPPEFQVNLKEANEELSVYCLRTLTRELRFNICNLEMSYLANSEIQDLNERVKQRISDALQYSCLHWPSHICSCSQPVREDMHVLLGTFIAGENPLYWLEALSLMGKVHMALPALRQVKECNIKSTHHLVEEILRFVLAFMTPISISTSAPHIYLSGLPFMPHDSTLWKNVRKRFPKVLDVCEGRMEKWQTRPSAWYGHTEVIDVVAYSPDGRQVVSGSQDWTIRIWDVETGTMVGKPLTGHTWGVYSVAYSPNGRYIVSGSYDRTIRLWDAETGTLLDQPITGHTDGVTSVAYSPSGQHIISGSYDGTVRIWDAETGMAVGAPLVGHTSGVSSVTYSPNGRHIVSGSWDQTIRIWDANTGTAMGEPLTGHTDRVASIACSPNNRHVVSGSHDGTIRIWDMETGREVCEPLPGSESWVTSVAYSPSGHHIISGSYEQTIRIWDAETGAVVGEPLTGHSHWVASVAYSPNGRHIISGSQDMTVRIWDAETRTAVGQPLTGHTHGINSITYSPNGLYIASGSDDQTIRIWNAETGVAMGEPLTGHTHGVTSVTYSPNGQYIVSGSYDQTVRIWNADTGVAVRGPLTGHTHVVTSVAYSPNGRHVVSGSYDKTIRIWNVETGTAVGEPLTGHTEEVTSVAYSPNGRRIVSSSSDGTIRMWDVDTRTVVGGEPLGDLPEGSLDESLHDYTHGLTSVAYSPSGRYIVSGSYDWDRGIQLWDAETGAVVDEPLPGYTNGVLSVAYSPNSRCIAFGSRGHVVRVFDVETRAVVGDPLGVCTGEVASVAYSPNGLYIVSGSNDRTIQIWNAEIAMAVTEPPNGWKNLVANAISNVPQIVSGAIDNATKTVSPLNKVGECDLQDRSTSNHQNEGYSATSSILMSTLLLDPNGWVCCADGILFWVPEDCRNGLTTTALVTIPNAGHHRRVRLNLSDFRYGQSWTDVYDGK